MKTFTVTFSFQPLPATPLPFTTDIQAENATAALLQAMGKLSQIGFNHIRTVQITEIIN